MIVTCQGCKETAERRQDAVTPRAWLCRSCSRRRVHASRLEDCTGLPIDSAATLAHFGYTAEQVGPSSQRRVIIRCTQCGDPAPRKRCSVTATATCRKHTVRQVSPVPKPARPTRVPGPPRTPIQVVCPDCNTGFSRHPKTVSRKEVWRCSSCAQLGIRGQTVYDCRGLPIDAGETQKAYGYLPEWLKPTSAKSVVIRCTVCTARVPRARSLVTEKAKCLHHLFSDPAMVMQKLATQSANHGPEAKAQQVARRKATLRLRYDETPFTWNTKGESAAERDIKSVLEGVLGTDKVTKKILACGLHLDLYVASQKLGVEYHGLHFHHDQSPQPRGADYHAKKMREAQKEGIRLIQIFEDEWRKRPSAVEQRLFAALGIFGRRIGARQCSVQAIPVKEAREFMEHTHVQGASRRSTLAVGLFHKGEILGAASLAPHHRNVGPGTLVLDRLCFAQGAQVIGGASRMMRSLEKMACAAGASRLITWSDNRWSEGAIYSQLGFTREADLPPDYSYVVKANPRTRLSKQSQKKSAVACPEGMTEYEWAQERGLARIWDCGKVRWAKALGGAS